MVKIAHIADVHIRNLKFHKEYRHCFNDLYKKIRKENVDIIYVAGDIAHTKTQLSPEYFGLCSNFLTSLADIATTYVILGNHDGNLRTIHRQDAITPIVEALNNPNLFLIKNSQEVEVIDGIVFNCLSIFDKDNWIRPTDKSKINIALYHGSISGCLTDVGWVMKHGEEELDIFNEFDYGMLGDIHKTNQTLDPEGRIRYAGSLIQQNHGESNDKGFLIWEIEDKNSFAVRHVLVENSCPYITIELTPKGRLPRNTNVPENARLRLVSRNNLPLDKLRRTIEISKTKFKPESVTFLNKAEGSSVDLDDDAITMNQEDLRDIAVQKDLIADYLKDYDLSDEKLEKIYDLNKKYNTLIEENEEIGRNVNWKLKTLRWDNLFNYGEDNLIDFKDLTGVVGIFGKNYSGKSSIIDAILYTIFNSTSKNERKNLNIINEKKDYGCGEAEILVGNNIFTIKRGSEKYIKKLKGKQTLEAKTDLNFSVKNSVTGEVKELNGLTRNDTDRNIRKYFGSLQDFLFTSMTSQMGALNFINEGSTKRKEILAKFLDLELFDKKFKLAKEDSSALKASIRQLKDRDFSTELKEIQEKIDFSLEKMELRKQQCLVIDSKINILKEERQKLILSINSLPSEIVDVVAVKNLLSDNTARFTSLKAENEQFEEDVGQNLELIQKIGKFLDDFQIEEVKERQNSISEKREKLDFILRDIKTVDQDIERKRQKIKLLNQVPCGNEYASCRFIKDAHRAKNDLSDIENQLDEIRKQSDSLEQDLRSLNPERNEEHLRKYQQVLNRRSTAEKDICQFRLRIDKNEALMTSAQHEIERCERKLKEYEENKEAIENLESLIRKRGHIENNIQASVYDLEACNEEKLCLYRAHGSLEQEYKNIETKRDEYIRTHEEFTIYDLFLRCMHSCGISYDIIKKKLPIINNEIAKVLANIANFEVYFEEDEKQLNIFIKHEGQEPRPIAMGSGAEKTIAAMAIRLSLLSVSNLPKPNIFILDEPGTALDESNLEGFVRILNIIKMYFKTVLLISHLESLKDCVDTQIIIDKKDGHAYVNQIN